MNKLFGELQDMHTRSEHIEWFSYQISGFKFNLVKWLSTLYQYTHILYWNSHLHMYSTRTIPLNLIIYVLSKTEFLNEKEIA